MQGGEPEPMLAMVVCGNASGPACIKAARAKPGRAMATAVARTVPKLKLARVNLIDHPSPNAAAFNQLGGAV